MSVELMLNVNTGLPLPSHSHMYVLTLVKMTMPQAVLVNLKIFYQWRFQLWKIKEFFIIIYPKYFQSKFLLLY